MADMLSRSCKVFPGRKVQAEPRLAEQYQMKVAVYDTLWCIFKAASMLSFSCIEMYVLQYTRQLLITCSY